MDALWRMARSPPTDWRLALTFTACFDSDAFTRAVVNGLRVRKGLAPWETTFCYAEHKARQFDLLAEAMRQHIDIDKIYTIMQQHQEPV